MRINKFYKSKTSGLIYLILVSILTTTPVMAIVNMDGLHFSDHKNTFSADLDFSISGSSGNTQTEKIVLNAQFSWQAEKSINLAILGYKYGKSNNSRNVNKAFAHYRYIHQLNSTLDLELFAQLETNEFTRLLYRGLAGSGVRFTVAKTEQHNAFFGLGAFYSKEEIKVTPGLTDDGVEEFSSANIYFLSKYNVSPSISFSNVIYYQPRLNKLSDYRTLLQAKFDLKINNDLTLRLSLDVEHDSKPSQGIQKTDISYMTGLKLSF